MNICSIRWSVCCVVLTIEGGEIRLLKVDYVGIVVRLYGDSGV